jgi:hypothetical protein
MIKHRSQLIVLVGACIVWGQTITEEIPEQGYKDSSVVTRSDSSAVLHNEMQKKDTSAITYKDTNSTILVDTTAVVSGNNKSNSDTVADTSTILDTAKAEVSTPEVSDPEGSSAKDKDALQIYGGRSGIGLNLLAKLFSSTDVNNFLEDVYDKWTDDVPGTIINKTGFASMILMMGVNLKGIIYLGPVVGLEPFGFASMGNKQFVIRDFDHEVNVSLIDVGGGVNIWARVAPKKQVSFKAGLGGYACYSTLHVDGYAGEVEFNGVGYGVNVLAGIDITLKKLAVNIDFILPVGTTPLEQEGDFKKTGSQRTIRYPKEYTHYGFEIRPGVTFQF